VWQPAAAWTVATLQIVLTVAPALTPVTAFAQSGGASVDRGREYYEQSRFDEAVALLQDLVDRGALSGADLQKARELLARSLVKKGYPVRARNLFKDILAQDPTWRPDPIRVPPDEATVFEQALAEFTASRAGGAAPDSAQTVPTPPAPATTTPAPPTTPPPATRTAPPPSRPVPAATIVPAEKKSNKTWIWIAGGVAAAGIIAAVAGGGGGGGDDETPATPLPTFPAPPTP
jgi:hypothetical protein